MLWVLLRRSGGYTPRPGWPRFLLRVLVAAALLAAVLALGAGPASLWLNATLFERVGRLAVLVAAGAAAYFGALALLGFRVSDFSRRDAGPMPPPPLDDD